MKLVVPSAQKISTMQTCIDICIGLSFPTNCLGAYTSSVQFIEGSIGRGENDYVQFERESGVCQLTGAPPCQRQQPAFR